MTSCGGLVTWLKNCAPHLGCEYGTYTCKVSVVDDDNNLMYKMFLTHGYGSIRSVADDPVRREANMKLGLKRKLQHKAADCAVMGMGHTHRLMIVPPKRELYLTDDGKRISQHSDMTRMPHISIRQPQASTPAHSAA